MIIGIIGAMDEELQPLLKELILVKKEIKAKMEFNFGKLYGKDIVIVRSGIGKVNAAICAQILIDDFMATKIINVGIAGGVGEKVLPGDIVIASDLVQHDMDTSAFGDKIGQIPRIETFDFKCDKSLIAMAIDSCKSMEGSNCFLGRIVTGDQFIANLEKIKWISSEFNAMACEMEGGSIAQVCYLNDVPFVVIRSISDNAENNAHMDYEKFKFVAVNNSTKILKNMLSFM